MAQRMLHPAVVFALVGGQLSRTTGLLVPVDSGMPNAFLRWHAATGATTGRGTTVIDRDRIGSANADLADAHEHDLAQARRERGSGAVATGL